MFFFLSKTLYYLLMPVSWIAVLLLAAVFVKKPRIKKRALVGAVVLFFLFSNPFLANEALLLLEVSPVPLNKVGKYDAGIVLTGIQAKRTTPSDRVYLDRGADRILHTVQLYRTGKIRKILISGGSGSLKAREESEAASLAKVFKLCGIPENDLILEEKSKNTRESAVFSSKIIQEKLNGAECLLITSAFHMRRAAGCYRKQNVQFQPFPTDFYGHERTFRPDMFIPSGRSFMYWHMVMKEWTGLMVYHLLGYTAR